MIFLHFHMQEPNRKLLVFTTKRAEIYVEPKRLFNF